METIYIRLFWVPLHSNQNPQFCITSKSSSDFMMKASLELYTNVFPWDWYTVCVSCVCVRVRIENNRNRIYGCYRLLSYVLRLEECDNWFCSQCCGRCFQQFSPRHLVAHKARFTAGSGSFQSLKEPILFYSRKPRWFWCLTVMLLRWTWFSVFKRNQIMMVHDPIIYVMGCTHRTSY